MERVYLDFETRSMADLKKVGGWLYLSHPTTDLNCVGFRFRGKRYMVTRPELQQPRLGHKVSNAKHADPLALELEAIVLLAWLALNPDIIFVAHNAPFEQGAWKHIMVRKYGFAEIPIHRWRCTMAKAYAHGLPGSLDGASKAMQLVASKDTTAKGNMLELAKPRKNGKFWDEEEVPAKYADLYTYCLRDVDVTEELDIAVPDLNRIEQEVWFIDQRMNQDGIHFDIPFVRAAVALADEHKACIVDDFTWATALEVSSPAQRAQLKAWLAKCNVNAQDTTKSTVEALLHDPNLPQEVRMALMLVKESSKTSLAKYKKILEQADDDGIIRDNLAYHAAHTGRWGGRGVQVQNLPRPKHNIAEIVEDTITLDYDSFRLVHGDVASALSSALRGSIIAPRAPGWRMLVADLSQMEARVLAWLAGETWVLDAYRNGEDLYCKTASSLFGRTITKENDPNERQTGKVGDLALGYEGGIGAFATMAKGYDLDLRALARFIRGDMNEIKTAEYGYMLYVKRTPVNDQIAKDVAIACDIIKQRWRIAHPHTTALWASVRDAAIDAVMTGNPQTVSGKVTFFPHKQFLYAKLPSGRLLAYPYPKVDEGERGKLTLTYISGKEGRISTYGGKLVENLVQAIQREILAWALIRLERAGLPAAFHVHDEIIAYTNREGQLKTFEDLIKQHPKWCLDMPIDAKGWEGFRYGKE